jgi:hypothetical protein
MRIMTHNATDLILPERPGPLARAAGAHGISHALMAEHGALPKFTFE